MRSPCVTTIVLLFLSLAKSFGQHPLDAEAAPVHSANNPREAVGYLIHAEDVVPGDGQLMHALSIESLEEIQTQLSTSTERRHIIRGIYLLAYKYRQYEQQIDSAKKDKIAQLLVTRAEQMRGDIPFNYLKGINHPLVRGLALKYQDSSELVERTTAQQLLRLLDEAPKANAVPSSVGPTVSINRPNDSTNQPSIVQKSKPPAMPIPSEESKPARWIWIYGGIVILGLLTFFLKRSKD